MTLTATYLFSLPLPRVDHPQRGSSEALDAWITAAQQQIAQVKAGSELLRHLTHWGWEVTQLDDESGSRHYRIEQTTPDEQQIAELDKVFNGYLGQKAGAFAFDPKRYQVTKIDDSSEGVYSFFLQLFNGREYQVPNYQRLEKVKAAGWHVHTVEETRHDIFYTLTRRCESREAARASLVQLLDGHYDRADIDEMLRVANAEDRERYEASLAVS